MISVCVAVYRLHGAPNVAGLEAALAGALDGRAGELVVALNGVSAQGAGVPQDARTVDLGANRGVSPAWNAAARAAKGDVLVFCNDDVSLGARSLVRLAEALEEHPDAGVVGPVGSRWDLRRGEHREWVRMDGRPAGEVQECEVVSGFLFACPRQVWEMVGGFEEYYAPASWEEVDFCTAVRAGGRRCYAVAGVPCEHEWGVSRRQPPWARARWDGRSETWRSIHRRNRSHFLAKWAEHPVARAGLGGSPVS
ncbi:MAG TPA: glycosyltransferase [Solirubrobacteraceae bacterium]|jgi:GT2 family glycosyltransferase|nr:glycosyltransferase [Solirubrobacteraceae bacterium]